MGKIAYKATRAATRRPNVNLLRELEQNSDTLDRIGSEFLQTIQRHAFHIYSFREEYETRKYLIFHSIVVKPDSAKIGHAAEEVSSIPADHSGMTKFESKDDVGFKRVSAQLSRWVDKIKSLDDGEIAAQGERDLLTPNIGKPADSNIARTTVLESLSHRVAGARKAEIHEEYQSTLQWLYDPKEVGFADWLGQGADYPDRIFWVQGKPGSGKSTLMKMALEDERTVEILRKRPTRDTSDSSTRSIESRNSFSTDSSNGMDHEIGFSPPWVKAGFFFHNRGIDMQKSLIGMLQDLLYQVLEKFNSLVDLIYPIYMDLTIKQQTKRPSWTLTTLYHAWTAIMKQEKIQHLRLILFLDALDEHESSRNVNNERLVSLIKELSEIKNENTIVLFCLASRPWTDFKTNFEGYRGFTMQDHTKKDIELYTRGRMLPNLDKEAASSTIWGSLIDKIVDRASGVFIWVRLVVDEMVKAVKDGTPFSDLEEKLERTPDELGELYTHTLNRIEAEYQLEAYIMIQLVIYARGPLQLGTLYDCVYFLKHGSHSDYQASPEEMRLFVNSRSGGLLETVFRRNHGIFFASKGKEDSTEYVQPIHQTVNDFVVENTAKWPIELVQGAMPRLTGFLYLLKCAIAGRKYSSMNDLRSEFLYYAQKAELDPGHLSPSEVSHCIKNAFHELLTSAECSRRLRDWLDSYDLFKNFSNLPNDFLMKSPSVFLLATAAAAGIGSFPARFRDESGFVHEHLKRAQDDYDTLAFQFSGSIRTSSPSHLGSFVYHLTASAAISLPDNGNVEPLEALKAAQKAIGHNSNTKALDAKSTLYLRFSHGSPASIVGLRDVTPLSTLLLARGCTSASSEDRLKAARYLLESGADPNSEIFLDWRPPRDPPTGFLTCRQTCLHHIARYESSAMLKLFLEHKADPNHMDSMNMTPLMHAALRNDRDSLEVFRYFKFEPNISTPSASASQVIWPWLMIPTQVGSAHSGRDIIRQRRANNRDTALSSYYYSYETRSSVSSERRTRTSRRARRRSEDVVEVGHRFNDAIEVEEEYYESSE
jgi:Ankyrin repeats (3 copies)